VTREATRWARKGPRTGGFAHAPMVEWRTRFLFWPARRCPSSRRSPRGSARVVSVERGCSLLVPDHDHHGCGGESFVDLGAEGAPALQRVVPPDRVAFGFEEVGELFRATTMLRRVTDEYMRHINVSRRQPAQTAVGPWRDQDRSVLAGRSVPPTGVAEGLSRAVPNVADVTRSVIPALWLRKTAGHPRRGP
jgi:hypothetical protein